MHFGGALRSMMGTDEQFWCAWIEGANVLSAWDLITQETDAFPWTLITMLDSNERVAELRAIRQLVAELPGQVVSLADGVLLKGDAFSRLRVHGDNFFTGYDELWMTCEGCSFSKKPSHLRISAEQPIGEVPVPGLGRWMKAMGICVGLGDGFGVNVATGDSSVVGLLRRAYGDAIRVADAGASW
jgi:hypothetical protein